MVLDPALGNDPDDLSELRVRKGDRGELVVYRPAPAPPPAAKARRGRRPDPPAYVVESAAYRALTTAERAVLRLAIERQRATGYPGPLSVRWVAENCDGVSKSAAAAALRRLEELGFLDDVVKGKPGKPGRPGVAAVYRVTCLEPVSNEFLDEKRLVKADRLKRARKVAGVPFDSALRLEGLPITSNTCEGGTQVDTAMHAKNSPKNGSGDKL